MKIDILMGSPNYNGSTDILVKEFARGAEAAGNTAVIHEICHLNIRPCMGCLRCGNEGPCVLKDDMEGIKQSLLAADMAVFATPLYYCGMSAQLKTVIDRFCSFQKSLLNRHMKSALLAVARDAEADTFDALTAHYQALVRYLQFEDMGMVIGKGCATLATTRRSSAPQKAYQLGKSL